MKSKWSVGMRQFMMAVLLTVMPVSMLAFAGSGGEGTKENPYQIASLADLQSLAKAVNTEDMATAGVYFKQTADIAFGSMLNGDVDADYTGSDAYMGIGSYEKPFCGHYDGDGHTITLDFKAGQSRNFSLFDYLGDGAMVENLHTAGTIQTSRQSVGGIAGGCMESASVTISHCTSSVNIVTLDNIPTAAQHGGLVGFTLPFANLTLTACAFTGSFTGEKSTLCTGLVGQTSGTVTVTGSYVCITSQAKDLSSIITQKSFDGSVTVTNTYYLDTITTDGNNGATAKTAAQFQSGDVCYFLNGLTETTPWADQGEWYQNTDMGTADALPVLDKTHYRVHWVDGTVFTNHSYTITVETATGGKVVSSKSKAFPNDEITLTVQPDNGYVIKSLVVKDASNNALPITARTGWNSFDTADALWYVQEYTFKMPSSITDVTVTPVFERAADTELTYIKNLYQDPMLQVPAGVTTFKVYDDGGLDGPYTVRKNGKQRFGITVAEGYVIEVNGEVDTYTNHKLLFYAGSDLLGSFDRQVDVSHIISTTNELVVNFNHSDQFDKNTANHAGFALIVTVRPVTDVKTITFDNNLDGDDHKTITRNFLAGQSVLPSADDLGYTNSLTAEKWNSQQDKKGTDYAFGATVTDDIPATLYVKWETEETLFSGDGTEESPYLIQNLTDLRHLATYVNAGNPLEGIYFKQTADIEVGKDSRWIPIGEGETNRSATSAADISGGFAGIYDGDGHVISKINSFENTLNSYTHGIFGIMKGTVRRLGVRDIYLVCYREASCGGIAGLVLGTVENCFADNVELHGQIGLTYDVAGIAGAVYGGTISNCLATNINYTGDLNAANGGGIVSSTKSDGGWQGTVTNCYTNFSNIVKKMGGTVSGGAKSITDEQLASGEICRKLHPAVLEDYEPVWYQLLGTDSQPVLDATRGKVFYCTTTEGFKYSNNGRIVYFILNAPDTETTIGEMAFETVESGTPAILTANTFMRKNYDYRGWNTAAEGGGTAYTDGQEVTLTENTTLYAQWLSFADLFNGAGTETEPYQVSTLEHLTVIADHVNVGLMDQGLYYKQTADIDARSASQLCIGQDNDHRFNGHYDGNFKTLNVAVAASEDTKGGFFGVLDNGTTITKLNITGEVASSGQYVGGLAAVSHGATITRCTVRPNIYTTREASASATAYLGGIIGYAASGTTTIDDCYFNGFIGIASSASEVASPASIASLVGYAGSTVSAHYCLTGPNLTGLTLTETAVGNSSAKATVENSYYHASLQFTNETKGTHAATSDQLADGTICWILNDGETAGDIAWFQNVDRGETDVTPVLDPTHNRVFTSETVYGTKLTNDVVILTYDANGGTGEMKPIAISTHNNMVVAANEFRRLGFNFVEWNTKADGTGEVYRVSGIIVQPQEDITLYAQWKPLTEYFAGEGTEASPYQIATTDDLLKLSEVTNNKAQVTGLYFQQTADLDLTDKAWRPIAAVEGNVFDGNYDGAGHTLKGINQVADNGDKNVGVFATVTGTVKLLGIDGFVANITVATKARLGAIAGTLTGTSALIENCFVINSELKTTDGARPESYAGALAGVAIDGATIRNSFSYNNENVEAATTSTMANTIVEGSTDGVLDNCYAYPKVTEERFKSGEVCWKLNGLSNDIETPVWYQTLGEGGDETPVFDNTHKRVFAMGSKYINDFFYTIPFAGDRNVEIPAGVKEFYVYDHAGPDENYASGANGELIITTPAGTVMELEGYVVTDGTDADFLTITDNGKASDPIHSDEADVKKNVGPLTSSTNVLKLHFQSGADSNNYEGVFLKVTVKSGIVKGDVNGDGQLSALDASLVLQHVAGIVTLTAEQQSAADVNGDGKLTALDASLILQKVAGIITEW